MNEHPVALKSTQKASFGKRCVALLFDTFFCNIVSVIIGLIINLPDTLYESLFLLIYHCYAITMEYRFQATLGKMIFKMKVFYQNGERPTLKSCIYRNLTKIISSIPLGYGYLRILAPHHRQTFHDEMSNCYVIKTGSIWSYFYTE